MGDVPFSRGHRTLTDDQLWQTRVSVWHCRAINDNPSHWNGFFHCEEEEGLRFRPGRKCDWSGAESMSVAVQWAKESEDSCRILLAVPDHENELLAFLYRLVLSPWWRSHICFVAAGAGKLQLL